MLDTSYVYIYIIYLILTTFFEKSESEFKGHIVSCSLPPQICILWLNRMRVKSGVPYTRTAVILMEILNKNFNKLIIFNKSEKKLKSLSHVRLFATPWTVAPRLLHPWDFPGRGTGVGCHCLL